MLRYYTQTLMQFFLFLLLYIACLASFPTSAAHQADPCLKAKEALKATADQQPGELVRNPKYEERPFREPEWILVKSVAGHSKRDIDAMDCAAAMRLAALYGVNPAASTTSQQDLEIEIAQQKDEIRRIAQGLEHSLATRDAAESLIETMRMLGDILSGELIELSPTKPYGNIDPLGTAIHNFTDILDGSLNPVPGYIRDTLGPRIKQMIEGEHDRNAIRLGYDHDYSIVVQSSSYQDRSVYAARWDSRGGVKWFVGQNRGEWNRIEAEKVPESARSLLLSTLRNPTQNNIPFPTPIITTNARHRSSGQEFVWNSHGGSWSRKGSNAAPMPQLSYGQISKTLTFALLPANERMWLLSRELHDVRELLSWFATESQHQRARDGSD